MFRRSDGNTSISPENIAGQSLSVGFRPLPQTTPRCSWSPRSLPGNGQAATGKRVSLGCRIAPASR
ncbi:hypothetical protein CKF74_13605, partial [Corynebacterium striatum]